MQLFTPRWKQRFYGYSSAVESFAKIHGSPIRRVVCFSKRDRVTPFVNASLQCLEVSCHWILTLSRWPTSDRIR